jgi:hypothetical protein
MARRIPADLDATGTRYSEVVGRLVNRVEGSPIIAGRRRFVELPPELARRAPRSKSSAPSLMKKFGLGNDDGVILPKPRPCTNRELVRR